jgi:hypothetical protein
MMLIGVVIGMIIAEIIFIYVMKKYMIVRYRMKGSFEDVEAAIKEVVPSFEGWSFPIPDWEFYKSQLSKGLTYKNIKNMIMHFVCKPAHANRVISVDLKLVRNYALHLASI